MRSRRGLAILAAALLLAAGCATETTAEGEGGDSLTEILLGVVASLLFIFYVAGVISDDR